MKNLFKIKNNFYLECFLLLYFTLFFFRGRLGSDDLEVFNLVLAFKDSGLNIFDFSNILKDNFTSEKLSSEIFINSNSLPDYKTLHVRFIWFLQSYIIVSIIDFFPLQESDFFFLSQYFCGLIISFYSCLSFLLLVKFFQRDLQFKESLFLSFVIFYSTGLISFFTGSYIESLIILLIIFRYLSKNEKSTFLIDYIVLLIKPYYYLILIPFSFKNLSKKNFLKKLINPIILFLLVYLTRQFLFDVSYDQYTRDYSNFSLNFIFILNNIFDQLFSFTSGIFITAIIPVTFVYFGYQKNDTIYKIIGLFSLFLFFSFFDGNHGQAPGGRYFLPALFIFVNEFINGFKFVKRKFKNLLYIFLALTLLNLPTLEYRNFNLPHYIYNSVLTGETAKLEKNKSLYDFPMRKIYFNHTIFSNKILFNKIIGNEVINIADNKIENEIIYPMTGLARIIFIIDKDIEFYNKKIPNIFNSLLPLLKFVYFITLLFIIVTFVYLIILITKENKKVDN